MGAKLWFLRAFRASNPGAHRQKHLQRTMERGGQAPVPQLASGQRVLLHYRVAVGRYQRIQQNRLRLYDNYGIISRRGQLSPPRCGPISHQWQQSCWLPKSRKPTMSQWAAPQICAEADGDGVHVETDPVVLAHARALLTSTPEGACDYLDADLRNPETILASRRRH